MAFDPKNNRGLCRGFLLKQQRVLLSIVPFDLNPTPVTRKPRKPGPVRIRKTTPISGPLAQRLEQRTHNPLVPGSNPGGPTRPRGTGYAPFAAQLPKSERIPSRHCRFDLGGESAFAAGSIHAGHDVVISFAAAHRSVRIAWFRHSGGDLRVLAA
jgi:hypothetical protein